MIVGPVRGQARESGLRLAFLLLLFVALSWQSYLVRAHFHPQPSLSSISSGIEQGPGKSPTDDRHLPGAPETCPICQEIAVAGQYLAAAPLVLIEPARAVVWYLVPTRHALFPRQRSHDWQSRAPPHPSRT